jgi:hypothetical protein
MISTNIYLQLILCRADNDLTYEVGCVGSRLSTQSSQLIGFRDDR